MNELRLYRRKSQILLLGCLVVIALILFTPISKNVYALTLALLQGTNVEFANRSMHLDLDYVYREIDENSIELIKIEPWFSGLDEINALTAQVALERHIKDFEDYCSSKPESCEVRNNGSYKVATVQIKNNPISENLIYNTYFDAKCNVYFSYIGEVSGSIHRSFVDRFFEENCN